MRFTKVTLMGAVAGLLAFTASPAVADEVKWKPVDTDSTWHCSDYYHHKGSRNVFFKSCNVVNASNYAQAVLVVQNKASVTINIEGEVTTNFGGHVDCAPSPLGAGATRGCYGPTKYVGPAAIVGSNARLNFNGIDEWLDEAMER
ncbi:hypothetical protein [Streptomyces sp. DH12]|uniref:hypothetical protein n=1 Tax=Streptomyces sp. DH12 TaxID=2857010 RepID=UPI001E59B656|nr:hypothetical protein [Streptomyces sp. DH12]